MTVFASLRSVDFDLDGPLPTEPEDFAFLVRLMVGPADSHGEESFDLTVCTPEWLASRARREGIVDARHLLVVDFESYDQRQVRAFLEKRVMSVSGENWSEVGEKLGRLGHWEFEDYQP